ncbi:MULTISPECIES: winged helix-turn-helix transcriptional regulator [Rhizobium]|uniref:winged helix-turn-helix transcriptional regulator n=1 Tax=Rhizobium TaxID=379 RepID=UPI001A990187|nr:helix-turn-helix domain-containing protein [Rhizobium bangladeshense]MBX4893410.1 helix-turn-helix transcriptional regulator [Rhizobium bangladeshense]MBX4917416.1 helix-turn-helix transcriptional regulator [Rhizobium bangladeshense]QSY97526.1 helix-turn-helix transcriptional regulator [Rhizobium bangladeshense]
MAKARHSRFDCSPGCSVEAAIGLIDGKWKSVVLFHLLSGTLRFNELRKHIVNVTPRMLTNQLRELEDDGLIERKVYAQVPPKVEYKLSELGRSMEPILLALKSWGDANISLYGKPRGMDPRDMIAVEKPSSPSGSIASP